MKPDFIVFKKKVHRVVDPEKSEQRRKEEPLDLEKGDLKAMMIAAFLTFLPALLVILAILALLIFVVFR
ncbi:MAG: hypothetical protein LBR76_02175 [Oscillospiraceae bacterium]|jgi:hypothetical protein|nr:hypothetical protein [Oscillospiraceae bacterium]